MVGVHPFFALGGLFIMGVVVAAAVGIVALIWRSVLGSPRLMQPPMPYPPGASQTPSAAAPVETPLDILSRRFASGEITAEEFQRARDLLQGGSPPAS